MGYVQKLHTTDHSLRKHKDDEKTHKIQTKHGYNITSWRLLITLQT